MTERSDHTRAVRVSRPCVQDGEGLPDGSHKINNHSSDDHVSDGQQSIDEAPVQVIDQPSGSQAIDGWAPYEEPPPADMWTRDVAAGDDVRFGSYGSRSDSDSRDDRYRGGRHRSNQYRSGRSRGARADEARVETPEQAAARAREICLTQLSRSARTRAQLAEALRRRGIPDDVAEQVLDRFTEIELIDDAGYAEMFVRSRHRDRGLARRALAYELRRRGVDDEVAGEALATVGDEDESATARRLVEAKLASTHGLDPQRRVRRLVGMLARKGYGPGVALSAVNDALTQEADEAADSWSVGAQDREAIGDAAESARHFVADHDEATGI